MEIDYQERVAQLTNRIEKNEMDAAILFNQSTIRYFTGFRVNGETESVLVIESDGTTKFLVPRLDVKRAERDCWISEIQSFLEDTPDYLAPLRGFINKDWNSIGIERKGITVNHLNYVQSIFTGEKKSLDGLVEQQLKVKTPAEIAIIRKSAEIASITMNEVKDYIFNNNNVTEQEASGYAKYVMEKQGAENYSFEPFIMSGTDGSLPRRVSTTKKLVENELILFDMGAIYEGYCSDITRTFALQRVNQEQESLFNIALKAQQKAIEAIKPGQVAKDIDAIARDHITANGYGEHFPHLTGHGLGVDIHEYPILDQGEESVLEENMVITMEPGIYVDNIGAARVEDMILVTKDGYEYLTSSPRDLILT